MASAARIVGFAHLLRTRSPHSPPAARRRAAMATARMPEKPSPMRREKLLPAPRKTRPRAARATMARKCFGARSRNGVETPKPVATSTAAAQPLISRQLATPRTAFRPKPRHREPPNRDERSSASSYFAASTTSLLTAASQQAAMLRILNAEASTVRATRRANSLAAMPFLAEVG